MTDSMRVLLLIALFFAGGCARESSPGPATPASAPDAAATATVTAAATAAAAVTTRGDSSIVQPSLYELRMRLEDQRGDVLAFDAHRGHPVLLAMFYATCPSACPALIADIRRIEGSLPEEVRGRVRVLLVSLDPAKDEPAILAEAARRHGVDPQRWTLARTSEDSVRDLAAVLGVKYRGRPDGEIDHSSAIFLLDGDGVIVERVDGLGQPGDAIVARLAPEGVRP